jgi:Flp pilus assembly protein TadD
MKELIRLTITVVIIFGLTACSSQDKKESADTQATEKAITVPERPTDAELQAFKVYHHMKYLVITADLAGGTN